ncbi:hypothetical protein [Bacillus massiliigorillae]|uniref:hypothetical protein n=1 Tax=Bacillus massiliigorillae TaxID=1243664 RepID=UPI0003A48A03|nr:hypothetical protein [Bacillus massiliigorillae]
MRNRKLVKTLNLILLFFTGIGALTAGFGFIADPSGHAVGMTTDILPKEIFPNYMVPGLFLFIVIGLGQTITALIAIKQNCVDVWKYIFFMGFVLVVWIVIQVALIGLLSVLQPIFFLVGVLEMILAVMWKKTAWRRSIYHF